MAAREQDERLLRTLKDAGCSDAEIEQIMAAWEDGNTRRALRLLAVHRQALLEEFHRSKNCIDCLDYLVFQMEHSKATGGLS